MPGFRCQVSGAGDQGLGAGEEQWRYAECTPWEALGKEGGIIQNLKSKIAHLSSPWRGWEAKLDGIGGDGVAAMGARAQTGADNSQ